MIAGGGFAMMAWRLAWLRKNEGYHDPGPPVSRDHAEYGLSFGPNHVMFPISAEYYRIVDNATEAMNGPRHFSFDCAGRVRPPTCQTFKL